MDSVSIEARRNPSSGGLARHRSRYLLMSASLFTSPSSAIGIEQNMQYLLERNPIAQPTRRS